MDAMDYWRLCDDLNVIQATLLILYKDPSNGNEDYVLDWQPDKRPKGFDAVYSALRGAINAKALPAKVVYSGEMFSYENTDGEVDTDWVKNPFPDWKLTTIKVDDLKKWLLSRGMRPFFFFPQGLRLHLSHLQSHHLQLPQPYSNPLVLQSCDSLQELKRPQVIV